MSCKYVAPSDCPWIKALCKPDVQQDLLDHSAQMARLFPELGDLMGFEQHNIHHIYDVWTHTVVCVQNTPPEPVLRVAALFHDVGKPQCFFLDGQGVGHNHGHARKGADMAREILSRWNLEPDFIDRVWLLIDRHIMQIEPQEKYVKRAMLRLGEEAFWQLMQLKRADTLALNPAYHESRLASLDRLEEIAGGIHLEKR